MVCTKCHLSTALSKIPTRTTSYPWTYVWISIFPRGEIFHHFLSISKINESFHHFRFFFTLPMFSMCRSHPLDKHHKYVHVSMTISDVCKGASVLLMSPSCPLKILWCDSLALNFTSWRPKVCRVGSSRQKHFCRSVDVEGQDTMDVDVQVVETDKHEETNTEVKMICEFLVSLTQSKPWGCWWFFRL